MQSDVYMNGAAETPVFDGHYFRERRGAVSHGTRRQSAPPRPPRPELNPWPKELFQTDVVEVSDENHADDYLQIGGLDSSGIRDLIGIQSVTIGLKQPTPGRISPISPISPVSEDTPSSAGYCSSSNVSPSNSLNKRHGQRSTLRCRPFSFESLRSAGSSYSQDIDMQPREQYHVTDDVHSDYADIAKSNPFDFGREIEERRPYSSHTYAPGPDEDYDCELDLDFEAFESVETASIASMHRAPSLSRHASEPEKTLDEAWEEVKKAVAPKLKIAIPPRSIARSMSEQAPGMCVAVTRPPSAKQVSRSDPPAERELPPCPSPPPVPARNPRRLSIGVSRKATVASTSRAYRLSQSSSSPNISKSFSQHSDVPPVPALPSEARLLVRGLMAADPLPAQTRRPFMHVPAPLPTPAASDCSASDSQSIQYSPPSPSSMRRANSYHNLHRHHSHQPYSSYRRSETFALPVTPPLPLSASFKRSSMGQVSSSLEPDQLSPRSRGFHEPPPVAPPPARFNTFHSRSTQISVHRPSRSEANMSLSPGVWAGPNKLQGTTFTTEIWAGRSATPAKAPPRKLTTVSKGLTLRTTSPEESSPKAPYSPPARSHTNVSGTMSSVVSGNTSNAASTATLASTVTPTTPITSTPVRRHHQPSTSDPSKITALPSAPPTPPKSIAPTDSFPALKTIRLSSKFSATSADDYLPKFSNNFAGFCKCAWRHQTAQTNKAFALRTITRKTELPQATTTVTKTTTLRCKKCNFEGPLAFQPASVQGASSSMDLSVCADKTPHTAHGVVYRWSFLFKSHIPSKAPLRKDQSMDPHASGGDDAVKPPAQVFGCLFCCAEGKGTLCFEGAKMLCGHIAKCHPMGVSHGGGERELRMRVGIVVGRKPEKGAEMEGWDIILPGRRKRSERTVKKWL